MNSERISTAQLVREHVSKLEAGSPFTFVEVKELGSRRSVDRGLAQLISKGEITRLARGIYVRPRASRFVERVTPTVDSIVRTWAESTHNLVEVHGAEAVREFGLSTQVPARPVYMTTGRSRSILVGKLQIELRHAAPSRFLFTGTRAGRAYAALRYLGRTEVTNETIEIIRQKLNDEEFNLLVSGRRFMPAWLHAMILPYALNEEPHLA